MGEDVKKIVARNVLALLRLEPGESGATAALIKLGIANGDATRVLQGETSLGLDKIGQIAAALKVQPWQLCSPGLDPDRLPTLEPLSFRWPFNGIDPEVITGLTGTHAQSVENGLLATLATVGINPRAPRGHSVALKAPASKASGLRLAHETPTDERDKPIEFTRKADKRQPQLPRKKNDRNKDQ